MISDKQVEAALDFIKHKSVEYAQAKADRRYLEEHRKSLKAKLFMEAPDGTVADREAWAYAHDDYEVNLVGLKAAVSIEEELRWKLEAAKIQTEIYRTQSANNRGMDRSAQ